MLCRYPSDASVLRNLTEGTINEHRSGSPLLFKEWEHDRFTDIPARVRREEGDIEQATAQM
jgi:hypothetical protein